MQINQGKLWHTTSENRNIGNNKVNKLLNTRTEIIEKVEKFFNDKAHIDDESLNKYIEDSAVKKKN